MILTDLKQELNDILPSLDRYIQAKENFKNNTATQSGVNAELERLIVELNEFIVLLYSYSTDPSETDILKKIKSF